MDTNFYSFRRLFYYVRPYQSKIALATLSSILNNIFDMIPEILIGITINVLVYKYNPILSYWGIQNQLSQLCFLAGIIFIVWCCQAFFEYLSDFWWRSLAQTIQHTLRLDVYTHIQQLELTYFENKSTGELLTILNEDVNQLENFFDKGVSDFIYFVINIIGVGAIFFYVSPVLALFSLFPIPIILFIAHIFQVQLGELYAQAREKVGELGAHFAHNLLGIFIIKSYAAEQYEAERLRDKSIECKNAYEQSIAVSAAFIPIVRITIACAFVIIIVFGGWQALQGALAIGSYSVLIAMTQRLLWPFMYCAKSIDAYKRSMASTKRVFAIIDTSIDMKDGHYKVSISDIRGKIEFKNVSFSYPNGTKVFDNLSLLIEPGQTIGIVGATGSGKTTLIKLLLRLYDPINGSILLDNRCIKDFNVQSLRPAFGLVSQDIFLFKGTIRENIAYASPSISDDQLYNAARIANIHDFIQNLPQGYDTVIGERGQRLSVGQRQRISIARAIINKPPILIFDEATSSVDNETELLIQQSLEKMAYNHTMFIIAHRLSTVRYADSILVINNGSIIEHGNHINLLEKNGFYAHLLRLQLSEK